MVDEKQRNICRNNCEAIRQRTYEDRALDAVKKYTQAYGSDRANVLIREIDAVVYYLACPTQHALRTCACYVVTP